MVCDYRNNFLLLQHLIETRRLHRRSLRLPSADEKKMGTIRIFGYYLFVGLKVGEGLDFQIWDLNGAHETEELFFQYHRFSACVDAD